MKIGLGNFNSFNKTLFYNNNKEVNNSEKLNTVKQNKKIDNNKLTQALRANVMFCGYKKNNKYEHNTCGNSKEPLKNFKFETEKEYSRSDIEKLLSNCDGCYSQPNPSAIINDIYNKLQKNDEENKYIKMLLQLSKIKYISPNFFGLYDNNPLNGEIKSDLDKIDKALKENKSLTEVFVPNYKDTNEALHSLKVGDVCIIDKDKTISIKKDDNTIEKLFITPDSYMELFPPVERFSSMQGRISDCVILATYNSLYFNPNSRHKILEMFCENNDDTIDMNVKFYGEDGYIYTSTPPEYTMNDISSSINKIVGDKSDTKFNLSRQGEATRAFETYFNYAKSILNDNHIKKIVNRNLKAIEHAKQIESNYAEINRNMYSVEELKLFNKLAEKHLNGDTVNNPSLVLAESKGLVSDNIASYNFNDNLDSDEKRYMELILERYKHHNKYRKTIFKNEIIPSKVFYELKKDDGAETTLPYLDYCNDNSVCLSLLNYNNKTFNAQNQSQKKELSKILDDLDFNKKYVLLASTSKQSNKILNYHTYSIKVSDDDKHNRVYSVINPFNAGFEIKMTKEELLNTFENITVANI